MGLGYTLSAKPVCRYHYWGLLYFAYRRIKGTAYSLFYIQNFAHVSGLY